MSHLLVLLVLLMTTFLSSPFSPASGQADEEFQFLAFWGGQSTKSRSVPQGGILELPPPSKGTPIHVCILSSPASPEELGTCNTPLSSSARLPSLPKDTRLDSTNSDVAEVSETIRDDGTVSADVIFKGFGSTTLQLRSLKSSESTTSQSSRRGRIRASYVLVFTPVPPGRFCIQEIPPSLDSLTVVDCSGKCVEIAEVLRRLGKLDCDDGSQRDDEMQPIDLSCASFIPEFSLTLFFGSGPLYQAGGPVVKADQPRLDTIRSEVLVHLNRLTSRATQSRVLDGGECLLQDSCRAQFGKAPDFHLCGAGEGVCSFNTTTGKGMPNNRGTCAAMCQQFRDSQCVAALNNNPNDPPGCTPNPNSRDTCETPRQTEICICERR